MKNLLRGMVLASAVLSLAVLAPPAKAAHSENFKAHLRGENEVPPNATVATGELDATISADRKSITYTLTYSNLEGIQAGSPSGTNRVLFAHFHFGPPREVGSVMVFLCTNSPPVSPPPQKTACPDDGTGSGTVSGTLTSADVVGPKAQGILQEGTGGTGGATESADDAFGEVIKAIESGESYTNVHSQTFPAGEIRGKNRIGREEGED